MKAAVCEDNPIILDRQAKMLEKVFEKENISCTIDTFSNSWDLYNSTYAYDFAFLDIEMPDINGIDLAKHIHKLNPMCFIFFSTSFNVYADEALNVHAFRFWVKPIEMERLIYGIESAMKEMEARKAYIRFISDSGETVTIATRKIVYIYTQNRKTHVITTYGEITTNERLKTFYEKLQPHFFIKTHASYIVNMCYIVDFGKNYVLCDDNKNQYRVEVSRRFKDAFDLSFLNWSGGKI